MFSSHAGLAAFLAFPMAVSIAAAVALAMHLPAELPARHIFVDGSSALAVILVFSSYFGFTWQLASSYFTAENPLDLLGTALVAIVTTAVLPVALLFGGLWWAGLALGSEAADMIARLRSLFVILPGLQVTVWGIAAAVGRFF